MFSARHTIHVITLITALFSLNAFAYYYQIWCEKFNIWLYLLKLSPQCEPDLLPAKLRLKVSIFIS